MWVLSTVAIVILMGWNTVQALLGRVRMRKTSSDVDSRDKAEFVASATAVELIEENGE